MKIIRGNLLDTELRHIAHGCNAQGVMGSGVAKAIRARWPECFSSYYKFIDQYVEDGWDLAKLPGENTGPFHAVLDGKVIYNVITQHRYGNDGGKYATYDAVTRGLTSVLVDMPRVPKPLEPLAIPKIGCGLGGLKWNIVEELLLELEARHSREFWVYEV